MKIHIWKKLYKEDPALSAQAGPGRLKRKSAAENDAPAAGANPGKGQSGPIRLHLSGLLKKRRRSKTSVFEIIPHNLPHRF